VNTAVKGACGLEVVNKQQRPIEPARASRKSGHAPKILHVIDSFGMGGAEVWLLELLRFWRRQGSGAPENHFLATSGHKGLFDEEVLKLGGKIFYVPYGRSSLRNFVRKFRRMLKSDLYDAIHDHQDYSSGWHFMMGTGVLPSVRVTHVHNPAYQIRNNYGVSVTRRMTARIGKGLVARWATHITGTSCQILNEYGFDSPSFDHLPKFALHCGFDTARFRGERSDARAAVRQEFGWPPNADIVLFAGRIDQSPDHSHPQNHKNSAFAVSVGIAAALQNPRLHVLFAGPPSPAVPQLEGRIASVGLKARFVFAGIRTDIARLMAASDVFLFPSRGEALGMVAVEAQAAGLPVLASNNVPREAVVVPELVSFQTLDADAEVWKDDLLDIINNRPNVADANERVAASRFAIAHSASALEELYRTGTLV
jgi:glycosyltransferase involved in cell wall biosynthesis